MRQKKSLLKVMTGLGLGAGLFWGCQNAVTQKSDAAAVSEANAALLQLAVKDSGACVELQSRCRHDHESGNDSQSLVTNLVDSCILDTAAAHRILGERHGRGDDDSDEAKLDSAAAKALCDSMTTVLAAADSTAVGYAAIKNMKLEACEDHRFPDTLGFEGEHRRGRGHRGWH